MAGGEEDRREATILLYVAAIAIVLFSVVLVFLFSY
jgi:hypothetical protein